MIINKSVWYQLFIKVFILIVTNTSMLFSTPFVYVVDDGNATVSKIDAATNTVVATINEGGTGPTVVVVSRDGKTAYVTNTNLSSPLGSTITPIDVATDVVGQPITVGMGPFFIGVPVTCFPKTMYVTNAGSNDVSPVDVVTNIVGSPIPVGPFPAGIAIAPDGKIAYVGIINNSTIVRIDTTSNTTIGTPLALDAGSVPSGIVITPDGKVAYVGEEALNRVIRIDLETFKVVGDPIPVGMNPTQLAITPNGRKIYMTNQGSAGNAAVSVIDTVSNGVVASIDGIPQPAGIAMDDTGKRAYVASRGASSVFVIDVATNTIIGQIAVGPSPFGVAITPLFTTAITVKPNIFLDHTELIGVITWTAAPSDVAAYRIYQGNCVIGSVKATEALEFFVHLTSNTLPQLSIAAVDKDGSESRHIFVCSV